MGQKTSYLKPGGCIRFGGRVILIAAPLAEANGQPLAVFHGEAPDGPFRVDIAIGETRQIRAGYWLTVLAIRPKSGRIEFRAESSGEHIAVKTTAAPAAK